MHRGKGRNVAVCKLGRELSPETKSASTLGHELLASRTARK